MTEDIKPENQSTEPVSPPTGKSQQTADAQSQLTSAVDDLLDQLQYKFDNVSRDMFTKLDDMTRRLDELEASLTASVDAAAAGPTGSASGTPAGTGSGTPSK
ncbi:hypothetical protein PHISCL_06764 [Aspergillus sclerotialis]|uniref:Heat shock factor binding protein n=1 Tax=Aspergillus sclerotialis TaxID=2070753 RepID=A0A3A2ZD77_9EURO|nr:hypothetical protein PHISCL_06764 [Aspergillus sclerotialis]